jgi:NitT/TauT family transport system substrate-binding protein
MSHATSLSRRALAAAFALCAALPLAGQAQTQMSERVVMAGWSKPISEITHLLAEPDKGFFKAQGLEFVYQSGAGGGDALRNLLSGQADVAFTDPGSLFAALDKGEKLRVIYDVYPQNVFNVVSLKSQQIGRVADLKGKRIGVYSLSSGTRQNLQVLLHTVGLSEQDVTIVPTGLLNFAPLMQGQVDATAATDTGLMVGRQRGLGDVNVMEVRQHLNLSSDVLVVREDTYQKRKPLLRRFLKAFADGALWMQRQPEEAAHLAVRYAIDGQNEATNLEVIKLRNASSASPLTQRQGPGAIDTAMMQKGVQVYRALGVLSRDIPVADFVATDLLPGK